MANNKDFILNNAVEINGRSSSSVGTITSNDIDLSTGNYFNDTLTTNTTYTFSNAGDVQSFQLEITGGGEGYNLSGWSYDYETFSVINEELTATGIAFKPDGTKMFICGSNGDDINEYVLSIPFSLYSAEFSTNFSFSSQDTAPEGIFFKPDGTKLYMVGRTNDVVFQYSLSTAWDISTASYDSKSFSVATQDTTPNGVFFKTDGTKMYIMGDLNNTVYQYTLSTAWDVSTASYESKSFDVGTQAPIASDLAFNDTGTKLFVLDRNTRDLYQYTLSTAWDVSTASYDSVSLAHVDQTSDPSGFTFADSARILYIVDYSTDLVHRYSTTDNYAITWPSSIEWEGGTAPATTEADQKDIFTFTTDDGGTSYVGVKSVENLS